MRHSFFWAGPRGGVYAGVRPPRVPVCPGCKDIVATTMTVVEPAKNDKPSRPHCACCEKPLNGGPNDAT